MTYVKRKIGDRRHEGFAAPPGNYEMIDGSTIEVLAPVTIWRVYVWRYRFPLTKVDLGWHYRGLIAEIHVPWWRRWLHRLRPVNLIPRAIARKRGK